MAGTLALVRQPVAFLIGMLLVLVGTEIAGQTLIRMGWGFWPWTIDETPHRRLFQRHPWLVVVPTPGASYRDDKIAIHHNTHGLRGPEFDLRKAAGQIRVICYGGSTTYGVHMTEASTWPSGLGNELGPPYQVLNAGVPGYTTAEHIIQTALQQHDLVPDIAVYYVGWNDLRNMHVRGLRSDYSDFHAISQYRNIPVDGYPWWERSALGIVGRATLRRLGLLREPVWGEVRSDVDPRALSIYGRNLRTLVGLGRSHGVRTAFVPQVFDYEILTGDEPSWWTPFVRDRDFQRLIGVYNQVMLDVCRQENVTCVQSVLRATWERTDFIDGGHFTAQGGRKFARLIAPHVRALRTVSVPGRHDPGALHHEHHATLGRPRPMRHPLGHGEALPRP